MREFRKTNPLTEIQRMKMNARSYAHVYLKRGKIEKKGCEVCCAFTVEMHHDDYSKPTEVRWLCRRHHMELHEKERNKAELERLLA
jgi:hypothetical protein